MNIFELFLNYAEKKNSFAFCSISSFEMSIHVVWRRPCQFATSLLPPFVHFMFLMLWNFKIVLLFKSFDEHDVCSLCCCFFYIESICLYAYHFKWLISLFSSHAQCFLLLLLFLCSSALLALCIYVSYVSVFSFLFFLFFFLCFIPIPLLTAILKSFQHY